MQLETQKTAGIGISVALVYYQSTGTFLRPLFGIFNHDPD